MPHFIKRFLPLFILLLFFIPYVYTIQDSFFWDTIQFAGKHGSYFYDNGWSFLPDEIDSGHLPFLGYYLSIFWHFFGKSLLVSHLAMLPFLCIYILSSFRLASMLTREYKLFVWAMFLFEPCFITQSTLVSPDVVLMAGFATMLYGSLKKSNIEILIGSILLVLAGNRGTSLVFAIGVIWLWQNRQMFVQKSLYLLPALIIFSTYQLLHFAQKGWIGYHEGMPWAVSFEKVGLLGMIKNFGILIWRLVDTGRVVLCLLAFILIFDFKKLSKSTIFRTIFANLLVISLILAVVTLPYKYLTGHRYYMPIYFIIIVFVVASIPSSWSMIKSRIVYTSVLISFLFGHFIVYPTGIAMGWDSTLAYLPYQSLRKEVINDLKSLHINPAEIGSYFPNVSGFDVTDLDKERKFGFTSENPLSNKYVLISNVMNDVPDNLYDELENSWTIIRKWKKGSVFMILVSKE